MTKYVHGYAARERMRRVLLLGDSIRLRYQSAVTSELKAAAAITGPAENCETSQRLLRCLPRWLDEFEPEIVHVNCGLHDLRHDPGAPGPQTRLEDYERNVGEILGMLTQYGVSTIWATTTPVDDQRHAETKASRRYESEVLLYNAAAMRQAMSFFAQIDDLHTAVVRGGTEKLLGRDGVHLTEEGTRLVAFHVATAIRIAIGLVLFVCPG